MKDYCLELTASKTGDNNKLNAMREYLQAYMLNLMYERSLFRNAAFVGGTALRFLHGLPRFSEDLDFSQAGKEKIPFGALMDKVVRELELTGYTVSVNVNKEKTVCSAFVKFEGLMFEAGISPLKSQKFSVKIEIDTNPPQGAVLETQVVNKYFPIAFLSYDLASLFAGKLNALLSRKYTKGRDFFDLGWYLSKWRDLSPNIALLTNGLKQAGWQGKMPSENNWRDLIYEVVKKADWRKVRREVENFLENPSDLNVFSQENTLSLIKPQFRPPAGDI